MKVEHQTNELINGRSMMAISVMYYEGIDRGVKLLKELKRDAKDPGELQRCLERSFDVLIEGMADRKQTPDTELLKRMHESVAEVLGNAKKKKVVEAEKTDGAGMADAPKPKRAKKEEKEEKEVPKEAEMDFDFDFGIADL